MTKTSKPAAITFPIIAKGVRRNAETGVEIYKDGAEYAIVVPSMDGRTAPRFALTLADARREATVQVEIWRAAIADAYDEAAEVLLAEIAETTEDMGPLSNRAISNTLRAAADSVRSGYLGAAARRLNRARNMLNGVGFVSDEDADKALAEQAARLPKGTRVILGTGAREGMLGTVTGEVKLSAEDGRPFVIVRPAKGGSGLEWCDSLRPLVGRDRP